MRLGNNMEYPEPTCPAPPWFRLNSSAGWSVLTIPKCLINEVCSRLVKWASGKPKLKNRCLVKNRTIALMNAPPTCAPTTMPPSQAPRTTAVSPHQPPLPPNMYTKHLPNAMHKYFFFLLCQFSAAVCTRCNALTSASNQSPKHTDCLNDSTRETASAAVAPMVRPSPGSAHQFDQWLSSSMIPLRGVPWGRGMVLYAIFPKMHTQKNPARYPVPIPAYDRYIFAAHHRAMQQRRL